MQSNLVPEQSAGGTALWGCELALLRKVCKAASLIKVSPAAAGGSTGLTPNVMWSGRGFPRSACSSVKWAGVVTAISANCMLLLAPTAKAILSRCSAQIYSRHYCVRDVPNHERERGSVYTHTPRKTTWHQERRDVNQTWGLSPFLWFKLDADSWRFEGAWVGMKMKPPLHITVCSSSLHCSVRLQPMAKELCSVPETAAISGGWHGFPIYNPSKLEKHLEFLCNEKLPRNETDYWYKSSSEHWQRE